MLADDAPLAMLELDQLEALADLIAARLPAGGPATDERKPLVNARQAAKLLAVDLKTVYRHAGELGGRKVGGAWRFDLDAVRVDHPPNGADCYANGSPQVPGAPLVAGRKRTRKPPAKRATATYCQLGPVPR